MSENADIAKNSKEKMDMLKLNLFSLALWAFLFLFSWIGARPDFWPDKYKKRIGIIIKTTSDYQKSDSVSTWYNGVIESMVGCLLPTYIRLSYRLWYIAAMTLHVALVFMLFSYLAVKGPICIYARQFNKMTVFILIELFAISSFIYCGFFLPPLCASNYNSMNHPSSKHFHTSQISSEMPNHRQPQNQIETKTSNP